MLAPPQARPCILLVEDDDAVRRSLLLLLKSRGFEVKAHSSAVGLARDVAALGCGCIVADLMMPQVDALQMLAEFHGAGWNGKAILISGFLDPGWEGKAHAAGFDVVLPKPISDSVLVRAVEELLPNASRAS